MNTLLFFLYPLNLTLLAASFGLGWLILVSTGFDLERRTIVLERLSRIRGTTLRAVVGVMGVQLITTLLIAVLEQRRVVPTSLPWVIGCVGIQLANVMILGLSFGVSARRQDDALNPTGPPTLWVASRGGWLPLSAAASVVSFLLMLCALLLFSAGL